jgi:hypothetical protein
MLRDFKTAVVLVVTALGSALVILVCSPVLLWIRRDPEVVEPDPIGDDAGKDVDAEVN